MEDKIAILGTHVDHLAKLNDEEEHYQRRLYPSKNGIDLLWTEIKKQVKTAWLKLKMFLKSLAC